MIPDFNTYLTETLWGNSMKRATGEEVRKEDKSRFDEPFKIIKESELIDTNIVNCRFWTPFNFGSDAVDKPGYYMNLEDIIELYEYLKDTDYCIASPMSFQHLKDCYSNWIPEKIGDYYGFNVHNIHILNFGYISQSSNSIFGKQKNGSIIYGDCSKINETYKQRIITIKKGNMIDWFYGDGNDKVQVRLIKYK